MWMLDLVYYHFQFFNSFFLSIPGNFLNALKNRDKLPSWWALIRFVGAFRTSVWEREIWRVVAAPTNRKNAINLSCLYSPYFISPFFFSFKTGSHIFWWKKMTLAVFSIETKRNCTERIYLHGGSNLYIDVRLSFRFYHRVEERMRERKR